MSGNSSSNKYNRAINNNKSIKNNNIKYDIKQSEK